ncbi:MAG: prepilin-type N-terminal cleavage/methylation domain-containing protein [Verrucomicrobiota bacterium]|jgi:general secretion pathway protein H
MPQLIFKNRKRGFHEGGPVLRRFRAGGPVLRSFSGGGFTLIEILIVVGIIGLTMTLGVPAFVKAMQREGMRKAQFDLLEAFRNARGAAILQAKPQDMVFRPVDGTFQAPGGASATLPDSVTIDLLGVNEIDYAGEESARVRFYPNGTCDEFIIIIHSLKDGSQCTITLDPVTALAEVQPPK